MYFPETGHHLGDRFLTFWRTRGGLPIFGYPISEPMQQDGRLVQYFERARLELHEEFLATPYEVQLTLLGSHVTAERTEEAFRPLPPDTGTDGDPGRLFFPQTGHTLAYGFKEYWERHGGLDIFGYPISEEFVEDGYTVQYFERARFEWHPEFRGTPYEVLLGHLGAEAAATRRVSTAPVARQAGVPDFDAHLFRRELQLPALMYHRFGDPAGRFQVPLWRFAEQLDWLIANGYNAVTLTQVYDFLDGIGTLPPNPVLLTFDDGHPSQWEAAAELDARGMKGVFFITTGTGRLRDDQIHDLALQGHEIGSHSVSHPNLRRVGDGQLWHELTASREALEAITGRSVDFFAYPYGEVDGRVSGAVASAGYRGGIHAWGGKHWTPEKRWVQPRIEISGLWSLAQFASMVR